MIVVVRVMVGVMVMIVVVRVMVGVAAMIDLLGMSAAKDGQHDRATAIVPPTMAAATRPRNKTLNYGFLHIRPQQTGRLKLNLT